MTEYTVNLEAVLQLSQNCYTVANTYAEVASKITRIDEAAGHLNDKDGVATAADTDVIALVDEFFEYLRTTSSRYHLAAEQLEKAAGTYADMEGDQQSVFQGYMNDWEEYAAAGTDVRAYDNADWDPTQEADDTARPEGTTEQASGFSTTENPNTTENTQGGN